MTNEFYTYLPYALHTEENALFLWDILDYYMFIGDTDFMRQNLAVARREIAPRKKVD